MADNPITAPPDPEAVPAQAPRKVYQSTLFAERRRRRASPWLVFPALLLCLGGLLIVLFSAQHRVRFVPTAGKIIYASDQGSPGTAHLWVTQFDGAATHLLTPGPDDETQPAFAPNGSQVAFLSDRDQSINQLFLLDADGKGLLQITHDSGDKSRPAWQPGDSRTLGYLDSGAVDTVTIGSSVGTPERLLPPPPTVRQAQDTDEQLSQGTSVSVAAFAWSPASRGGLAAVEATSAFQALSVMPSLAGASTDVRKTPQGVVPLFAAGTMSLGWSPDGHLAAVAAINVEGAPHPLSGLFLFEPDGTPVTGRPPLLIGSATTGPQDPVFSPDGSQILFQAWNLPDLASRSRLGLYLVPADGSQPPRLVYKGAASDAQFSPHGNTIFFLLKRTDGGHDLCRISAVGTGFARLSNGTEDVSGFTVSPQTKNP